MSELSELGMRIGIVLRNIVRRAGSFPRATRGNVAMIFGFALIPLCLAAGVGLDMSRAMITRVRMGAALDAAGLAVGTQPGLSNDQMTALARQYFKQNYTADPNVYGQPTDVVVDRPAGSQTITLSTQVAMPTVLMRIVGIDTMSVGATSQITWGQTKLWVALVLDNTGSMCEPGSQPCPTPIAGSKMTALKNALQAPTTGLFDILKNAASNPGDVQVSIVPFAKDVTYAADASGTDTVNAPWIDWTDWEAPPPNTNVTPSTSVGPGSSCPWSTSSYGFTCINMQSNKIATTGTYAGMICPGMDNGNVNKGDGVTKANRASHYYNGCYNSVPTKTLTTTVTSTTTQSSTATCTSDKNGNCTGSTTTTQNSPTSTNPQTSTATTSGYTGDSGPVTTTSTADPVVGAPKTTSSSKNGKTTYTTKVTTSTTTTTTVVTKTGAAPFNHTWIVNDHSTWDHCFMDRPQVSGDTGGTSSGDVNLYPGISNKFTAENSDACPPAGIAGLSYDWNGLSSEVDAMTANGNTNQTVGLAWGWQTLSNSDPFNPGVPPTDTKRYIILLTDGLNTQNRTTTNETSIDARTKLVCQNIKADGITIYAVYVNLNPPKTPDAGQLMLQACASDGDFFALTQVSQIPDTFTHIATEITNLRVSL